MSDASSLEDNTRHEAFDNPLERLRLLSGDDDAIASFLDELDIDSTRERELLAELARTEVLAQPDRFDRDHRRLIEALESLRRHGFHGSQAAATLGPGRHVVRWLVELVARYLVVSHVKSVSTSMRNLYWLRELQAEPDSRELKLLRPARFDASALCEIMRSREVGVPSFVIAGLLIPAGRDDLAAPDGVHVRELVGRHDRRGRRFAIGLGLSWTVLRGTALASSRIRTALLAPLQLVWDDIGSCGQPPRDRSRNFAAIAIVLAVVVWIVLPAIVALAFLAT